MQAGDVWRCKSDQESSIYLKTFHPWMKINALPDPASSCLCDVFYDGFGQWLIAFQSL
jgi:hypothetical protein